MDKQLLGTELKDLFESWGVDAVDPYANGYSNAPKQPSPRASFPDDPLALSCASYRLYKQDPHRRFTNIDSVNATQEDRIQAQAIRDYYNQRYTMRVLKGGQLTEYQQKTAQFLSGLHHLTTEEQLQMLRAVLKRSQKQKERDFEQLMKAYLAGDAEQVANMDDAMTRGVIPDA